MPLNRFSVLVSPTYRCNADCEYCFQHKTSHVMEVQDFESVLQRIATYLQQQDVADLKLYWQGGDIFTMSPEWFLRAHEICQEIAEKTCLRITHLLQSNLIGYSPRWRRVVAEMFDNDVGSSLDFPNLYRKVAGGTPEAYNDIWLGRYQEVKEAGIQVGAIAVLNNASLSIGAREFYSYYVEKLGIGGLQINTPYPGGAPTPAKRHFPLDNDLLGAFYSDLFDLWMVKGRPEAISISPLDVLVQYFRTGENRLNCVRDENCATHFISIDPRGNVGACNCFTSSYPDYRYGNILLCPDMAEIMNSPVRKLFLERPVRLMEEEDCAECDYLTLCHGGCTVRAYSSTGSLYRKDAYCQSDKTLFRLARNAATELNRLDSLSRAKGSEGVTLEPTMV
jgi:uncharacterized protein